MSQTKLKMACREANATSWCLNISEMKVSTTWCDFAGRDILTGQYYFGEDDGHFIIKSKNRWVLDDVDRGILAVVAYHKLDPERIRRSKDVQDLVIRWYTTHFDETQPVPPRKRVLWSLNGVKFLDCQCGDPPPRASSSGNWRDRSATH